MKAMDRGALWALIGLAMIGWGCTYRAGGLVRGNVDTVYVAFFDNSTYRRGLEVPLTRAVVDEIKLRTQLLFAPRDQADSVLMGELLDVDEDTRLKTEEDEILITSVVVRVRFRWRDKRTGRDIVPEQTVVESARVLPTVADVAPAATVGEARMQLASTSAELALQQAAQRIVERMEKDW